MKQKPWSRSLRAYIYIALLVVWALLPGGCALQVRNAAEHQESLTQPERGQYSTAAPVQELETLGMSGANGNASGRDAPTTAGEKTRPMNPPLGLRPPMRDHDDTVRKEAGAPIIL